MAQGARADMSRSGGAAATGVRALGWMTFAGRPVPILPLRSVIYFALSFAVIATGLVALDRVMIPAAQHLGQLQSKEWVEENQLLNRHTSKKNRATQDHPVWRSAAIPVTEAKRRPRRILVMGDSFVWGDGMANVNDIWWRQLQRELERRGYGEVEVIAAGMCGWSTRQQLEAARRLLSHYRPDAIVWGYVTNDPDEGLVEQGWETRPEIKNMHGLRPLPEPDGLPLLKLRDRLDEARDNKVQEESTDPDVALNYDEWERKIIRGENLERYAETVLALGAFQRETGLPGLVMTLPNQPMPKLHDRYEPVAPLFKRAGMPWLDILDDFIEAYPPETQSMLASSLRWGANPANGHPGPVSTAFYARRAADYLERHHAEVLGRKGGRPVEPRLAFNDWTPFDLGVKAEVGGWWRFEFPKDDEPFMLTLPIGKRHVLLCLESPIAVRTVEVEGSRLAAVEVHVSSVDPELRHDTGTLHALPAREGRRVSWPIRHNDFASSVNTLRIVATFDGRDRTLRLRLTPDDPGALAAVATEGP